MAPAVGEPTPTQPWSLFKPTSWGKGGSKKIKVAHLPEESNMYYHPELKRWVERGKEGEAAADPGNAPPPTSTVFGTSVANAIAASGPSGTMTRKAVASRYVLQNNLSVSSSASDLTDANRLPSSTNLLPSASSGILPSPRASQAGGPAPPPKGFFLPNAPAPEELTTAQSAPAADKPATVADKGFNFYLPGSADLDQTAKTKGNAWAGYSQTPKAPKARRSSKLGNPAIPTASPPNGTHAEPAGPDSQQPWSHDTSGGVTPPPTPSDHVHGAATPDSALANGMHAALAEEAVAAAWGAGYAQDAQVSSWQAPHADTSTAAAADGVIVPAEDPDAWQHQQPQHQQQLPPHSSSTAADSTPGSGTTASPPLHEQPSFRYAGNGAPPVALENQCSLGGWAVQSSTSLYPGAPSSTSLPNPLSGATATAPPDVYAKPSPPLDGQGKPASPIYHASNGAVHGDSEGVVQNGSANGARIHDTAKGLHSQGRKLLGALAGYVAQQVSSLDSGGGGGGGDAWGFEAAMHPGSADKLDGPLPWELPEELRYSDEFLSICTAWQRNNPGKLYSPELLVPPAVQADGIQLSAVQADSIQLLAAAGDVVDSPGGAWRKGHALRKQQEEQEQEQGQIAAARSAAAPLAADGLGAEAVGLPSPPAQQQHQQEVATCDEQWPLPAGHRGFGFGSEFVTAASDVEPSVQTWDSSLDMPGEGDVEGLACGVQGEALGIAHAAPGRAVEEAFGTEVAGYGEEAGAGLWPEQEQQWQQEQQQQQQQQEQHWQLEAEQQQKQQEQQRQLETEQQQQLQQQDADLSLASGGPHAVFEEPPQHHAAPAPSAHSPTAVNGYAMHSTQGAVEDDSSLFFADDAEASAGAEEEDGSSFFATVGAGEAPAQHSTSSWERDIVCAGEEVSHAPELAHEVHHGHEVDRVVSDLVSSLEPGADEAEAAGAADADGWDAADGWLHEDEPADAAVDAVSGVHGGEDPHAAARAQAAALLSQLLLSLQAPPGVGAPAVDRAALEQTLALVATALGHPGAAAAAHGTPTKAGGGDAAASLLTPQRAAGATGTGFLSSPSPSPAPSGAEEGGSPQSASSAQPQLQHYTPDYHAPGRAERQAKAAADDAAAAEMKLEMQGAYDVKLAARTSVLEAELVSELAACSLKLEIKFAAKLAERAAELETKFESEVSSRASKLERKFEAEVLSLREALRGDYEGQLAEQAAALAERAAALAEREAAERATALAVAAQLAARFEAQLAGHAQELEARFEAAAAARASKLEGRFESEVLALRAGYEGLLAEKEAALAEKEAALEEAMQRCSEMQDDQDQLLLCLGQESRKVADLSEAMQAAGLDVDSIIAPIEEEYAMMDELPQEA